MIKDVNQTLTEAKTPPPAILNQINRCLEAGQFEEALEVICESLLRYQNSPELLTLQGATSNKVGRFQQAITCLQKAIKLQAENAESYYHLGIAFQEKGEMISAVKNYEKAIELAPKLLSARNKLGSVLLESGYPDASIDILEELLEIIDGDSETHLNLGKAYESKSNFQHATKHYSLAQELMPENLEILKRLGVSHQLNGAIQKGRMLVREAEGVICLNLETGTAIKVGKML